MTTVKMMENLTESVDKEPIENDVKNNKKHKRKSHDNPVLNFINENRQHLEKGLSARQDQL